MLMRNEEKKGSRSDVLKYLVCAGLLVAAWFLWQRHLGPELREALSPPNKAFLGVSRD